MAYEVGIRNEGSSVMAAVRDRIPHNEIGDRIVSGLSEVYAFLGTSGISHLGLNAVMYEQNAEDIAAAGLNALTITRGVIVGRPFTGNERIVCASTPEGKTAHVSHFGPYNQLGKAHNAIRTWCDANGRTIDGINWELYGHWTDNVNDLRTDVFYLLKE